jgi:transposase-like protein
MEQWSGPERAVAVSAYYWNGDSVIAAQRVFRRHYEILSAHAIRTWVRNFEETGSALKKKKSLVDVVHQTRPTNFAQLKTQIEENITNIPENTSRHATQNLQNRLTECVQWNGRHLTDVIFKKWCLMKFPLL